MSESSDLSAEKIRALAEAAGLSLKKGREAAVSPILTAWLADAHELNRKMSARKHWAIMPLTVFTHPRK